MTKQELNRDVKRLTKKVNSINLHGEDYYNLIEKEIKPEISRLYNADRTLKSLNADSLRALLRMNLKYRAMPLHIFGLFIEL